VCCEIHKRVVGGTYGYHIVICGLFTDAVVCRDSVAGTETRYGLDDPGIESRCGRDFPHPPRPAPGPIHPPIQWVPGIFPGVKATGGVAQRLKKE